MEPPAAGDTGGLDAAVRGSIPPMPRSPDRRLPPRRRSTRAAVARRQPLPPCQRTVPVGGDTLAGAVAAAAAGRLPAGRGRRVRAGSPSAPGGPPRRPSCSAPPTGAPPCSRGRLQLDGAAHVVIEGFDYMGASGVTITNANHNRITRSRFRLGGGTWVSINGTSDSNRFDHNELGPMTAQGHFINPTGLSERTRIDHNYFHDFAPCGGNGCEAISLGCCGAVADAHETFNVVEHNLLVNCDGESEMIGMKSSSNTIRFNTIRTSRGQISFRAGKKNTAHSNYILGGGKPGTQGIRLLDEDHLVYNNYVDVAGFPLRMQHGDVPGFPPIKRARVVHNTFVVNGAAIELGGTSHSVAPAESTFANNLILGSATLDQRARPRIALAGNIAFPMGGTLGVDKPADQIEVLDPQLTRVGEIWRPTRRQPRRRRRLRHLPLRHPRHRRRTPAPAPTSAPTRQPSLRGPLTAADVGPDGP